VALPDVALEFLTTARRLAIEGQRPWPTRSRGAMQNAGVLRLAKEQRRLPVAGPLRRRLRQHESPCPGVPEGLLRCDWCDRWSCPRQTTTSTRMRAGIFEIAFKTDRKHRGSNSSSSRAGMRTATRQGRLFMRGSNDPAESPRSSPRFATEGGGPPGERHESDRERCHRREPLYKLQRELGETRRIGVISDFAKHDQVKAAGGIASGSAPRVTRTFGYSRQRSRARSTASTRLQIVARRAVRTPIEQPASNALTKRRPTKASMVGAYRCCS